MGKHKPSLKELCAAVDDEQDLEKRAALFKRMAPQVEAKFKVAAKAHRAKMKRRANHEAFPLATSDEFKRMWNTTVEYVKRYAVEGRTTGAFAHDLGDGLRV